MIWAFALVGGLLVIVIAFVALGQVVGRLEHERPPAVYELEGAVDWIADRLPDEVTARLSYDDVRQVLRWHLDWFADSGLSSRYGEELGGEAVPEGELAVGDEDRAVEAVVARSLAEEGPDAVDVVCVLDLQMRYLEHIGALGDTATVDELGPGPDGRSDT